MLLGGTVPRVGSVTGNFSNFQSEAPLHPAAREFLAEAFDRGWADPRKPQSEARRSAILLNEAKETFAGHLGVRADQLEILSSSSLGFHLGITGLARPESQIFYPATSRSEIFAELAHLPAQILDVGLSGSCAYPVGDASDLLCWQSANGETGVISALPTDFSGRVFVDATASGSLIPLPQGWTCALWDPRAWSGPAGFGLFALSDRSIWRNPLPHLDQSISSSDFSVPLAIAGAIALDAWATDRSEKQSTFWKLNQMIRTFVLNEIGDADVAGDLSHSMPHLLSFSLLYIDAERLVGELDRRGFAVDSGSACTAKNMEPSHVLAAMGLLTHGNIRITLHDGVEDRDVLNFLRELKSVVTEMRS